MLSSLLFFLFSSTNIGFTQSLEMYSGTWTYLNGNEKFIVYLWKVPDGYNGHYKLLSVDNNGNTVSTIYDSNKEVLNTGYNWPSVITTGNSSQNQIGGIIIDNIASPSPQFGGYINGQLRFFILNPNCFNNITNPCPLQAQWTVIKMPGLSNPDEPEFTIPTNITLIKE